MYRKKTSKRIFIVTLLVIIKFWRTTKYILTKKWINCSKLNISVLYANKMNELKPHVLTWINLKNINELNAS